MKKTYIIPNTTITVLTCSEHILDNSAKIMLGETEGPSYGGKSEGGMSSDVKSNDSYNVWDDDWSR